MVLRRVVQLLVGLFFYGVGLAMLVRSMLGAAPWDVLTLGVSNHVPLSFGMVIILVSVVVLLCWIPLRERPGLGTVLNALLVGPAADFALLMIPEVSALWVRVLLMIAGVTMVGLATGLYIGARFGPGPRDGLMTGLHRVTGKPIWVVRTGLEIIVVTLGWLLGGVFGIGTVVFALAIGPLCQFFIPLFDVEPRHRPDPEPAEASAVNVRGRAR
ncbi:YczE/YyaS/YitT family protein [Citricoccus muralis]|uniref:Membrane protein YczE n=1 Tax=Citricoccus muralis TaxID=169134 RepID=A0ABY8H9R6_9MICC|nr:hypothetical protein [Citricoccus muralis]WFP17367.1 hypothetical protein P8192_04450 [Citricoccus muralis]